MDRNKLYRGLVFLALAALCVWFVSRVWSSGKEEEPYVVSVILDDSNNDRWMAMKQGLEQGASDFNVRLNVVSTGEFADAEEELALLRREVGNSVDGVIIQMVSSEDVYEELMDILSAEAVVLLETDITPEDFFSYSGSDNAGIGTAIGDRMVEDLGERLSGVRIGLLSGNQHKFSAQQCRTAFLECMEQNGAEVFWELDKASEEQLKSFLEEKPVDILVALENTETEQAVDYLVNREEETSPIALYGVGASEKLVYYLDRGIIQWLVVPNEYHMGYAGVENIVKQLQPGVSNQERTQADYLVVNKDNMYHEDNQKILFPIVQ